MKLDMFVFLGLSDLTPPIYINEFTEKLKGDLTKNDIPFSCSLNKNLLILKTNDFSYYVAFSNDRSELTHWSKMGEDFELESDENFKYFSKVTSTNLSQKIIGLRKRDKHYAAIAPYIINKMRNVKEIEIFCFH